MQAEIDSPNLYLCQVNETVSCGACCGLYNVADPSRTGLEALLIERTEAFAKVLREMEAILTFGSRINDSESRTRPCPDFHHCPYIGLVGSGRSRVGCLLHPENSENRGIDFRGLSFYGGMACRIYFCPSCRTLSRDLSALIHCSVDDWYLYGLIITEIEFLEILFYEIRQVIGETFNRGGEDLIDRLAEPFRALLSLKIDWPFRPSPDPGPCNYFFEDRRYLKPPVHYDPTCRLPSRYHALFQELVSSFNSMAALEAAEALIDRLMVRFADSIPENEPSRTL